MIKNIYLDGQVFFEGYKEIKNKYGMLRVAENITKLLSNRFNNIIHILNSSNSLKSNNKINQYLINSNFDKSIKTIDLYYHTPLHLYSPIKKYLKIIRPKINNNIDYFHSYYHPYPNHINAKYRSITLLDIIPLTTKGYSSNIVDKTIKILKCLETSYGIAISQFTKNDILNYSNKVKEDQIFCVPLAADSDIFYCNKNKDSFESIKLKYGVPENYILCLSSSDKRKNIETVLTAFNNLVNSDPSFDCHLFIAGNFSYDSTILKNLSISNKTLSKIKFSPIFIEEEDLSSLYSNAIMFIFVSLYEGFGLPVLEAMACKTAVICSNTTSLPEITLDNALLVAPKSVEHLYSAISTLYYSETIRNTIAFKGYIRSLEFTWEKTADEYFRIFNHISNISK